MKDTPQCSVRGTALPSVPQQESRVSGELVALSWSPEDRPTQAASLSGRIPGLAEDWQPEHGSLTRGRLFSGKGRENGVT